MSQEASQPPQALALPVWLDRRTPPHIATLVALTGISALNINMILPALPSLAAHYQADYAVVALAVSAYLGLTAVLQLIIGPLSDRYGRRPVVLASFAIFIAATLGTMFAPTIGTFLAFRMMQASVASGFALSRAIVRDTVPADEAASQIGYVTMGMSLMPMIGPLIGGFLVEISGWQSIFAFTFVSGALVLGLMWIDLGETNIAPSASFAAQFRAYPELFRSRRFWGYAVTATVASGAFFAFLGGGPWVATNVLDMSPSRLGFYFGFIALGYMGGNFLSGRYARRAGLNAMMLLGAVVATVGMTLALVLLALGIAHPLSFFGTILFVGLGNGLLLPSANAGMVSVRPHLAGSASGLGAALTIGGGALLSVLAGAVLSPATGAWPLLWMMFLCSAFAIASSLYVMRVAAGRAL